MMVERQTSSNLDPGDQHKGNPEDSVPEEFLQYSKGLFDRCAADFDHLDNKAVGLMAVVGLLVGFQALNLDNLVYIFGAIAGPEAPPLASVAFLFLGLHGSVLLATLILALMAFQVQSFEYPCDVSELITKFRDKSDKAKLDKSMSTNYARACLRSHIVKQYEISTSDIFRVNSRKARLLKWSVFLLIVSIITLGGFVVLLALTKTAMS